MRNFFKGSIYISAFIIVLASIISCEEDFTDIGTSIIVNNKFSTNEILLDLEIKPINIASVDADRTGRAIDRVGDTVVYRLGLFNTPLSKKIKAGFVTQLSLPSENLRTQQDGDTVFKLDKVFLKIPYSIKSQTTESGIITYKLDSIFGNTEAPTNLKVYRNPTFLNSLNPENVEQGNRYLSDFEYGESEVLSIDNFSFSTKNIGNDTCYSFYRLDRSKPVSTDTIKDVLKLQDALGNPVPFLTIPLDFDKMKDLFWDEFENPQFKSGIEFQNYFRGLIVKVEGEDGAMVSVNLSKITQGVGSVDFLYSKLVERNDSIAVNIKDSYSFPFNRIVQNNIYDVDGEELPNHTDSFLIQGLAGASAEINVLGVNLSSLDDNHQLLSYRDRDIDNNNYLDLKELASIKDIENNDFGLLANKAEITFNVNTDLSSNQPAPSRLYLYENSVNENGQISPKHLSDSFEESSTFNGVLKTESSSQKSYSFTITDYISDILDGSVDSFFPLILKVYNVTDNPLVVGPSDSVTSYSWDPKFVILHNGNDNNGLRKAQLKLSFTSKK